MMVLGRLSFALSLLLLVAIGAKLIGPHGGRSAKCFSSNGIRRMISSQNSVAVFVLLEGRLVGVIPWKVQPQKCPKCDGRMYSYKAVRLC